MVSLLQRVFVVVLMWTSTVVLAGSIVAQKNEMKTVSGTVASTATDSITLQDKDNKESTYSVEKSAKVTIDGEAAVLTDLKKGAPVTLTMDGDKVLMVESNRTQ